MTFGVGIIGATGFIGTPYRGEIRDAPDDAHIVALCARRRDRLEAAAVEDGCDFITDQWRRVVEHPDVDLVLVLTPDALHYEPVLASVVAGKHLFCEKPIGKDLAEAREMFSAVRDARLAHFVPFWTRYVPVFQRAREIVKEGTLGEVRVVIYRWHNPRPAAMPFTWRDDASLSSAGSIADVGSHAYDVVRWILGCEATRVMAHADVITPAKPDLGEIDLNEAIAWAGSHTDGDIAPHRKGTAFDYATIAWQFVGEAVGAIILSHAPALRKGLAPELELHGTKASLAVDRIRSTATLFAPDDTDGTAESIDDPGFGNRFTQHVFPSLRQQIAGERGAHPGMDDALRVQLFTEAAATSAKRGTWVELAELESPITG